MLREQKGVSNSTGDGGMCNGVSVGDRERFIISIQLVFIEHPCNHGSPQSHSYQNVIVDVAEGLSSFVTPSLSTVDELDKRYL